MDTDYLTKMAHEVLRLANETSEFLCSEMRSDVPDWAQ